MTKGTVRGIQIHDNREKDHSHTNKDIDWSKSDLNYNLAPTFEGSFYNKINSRIQELSLPRKVRKDAIVMTQCLVTSDKGFFDKLTPEEQKRYFQESYDFIKNRYGEKNIISAIVHMDEKTPHMHVNFVPVTSDGRLSAKDLFGKMQLSKLHDDFFKNVGKGWGLERGQPKAETQKHIPINQFKAETLQKELKEIQNNIQILKNKENAIQNDLNTLKGVEMTLNELECVKAQKIPLTGKISLNKDDFERIADMAKKAALNDIELNSLKSENVNLKKEISENKRVLDKYDDRNISMSHLQLQYRNLDIENKLLKKFIKTLDLDKSFSEFKHVKRMNYDMDQER